MNTHEILLKLKSVFTDTASAGVNRMISGVQAAARGTTGLLRGLGSQLESLGGAVGKVAGGVTGCLSAFKSMGIVGGIVAGATMAIDFLVEKCMAAKKAAAEAALEFANFVAASGEASRLKAQRDQIDKLNAALAQATTIADQAAKRFDALADAYLKVAKAAASMNAATAKDTLSQLNYDKQTGMMNAGSKGEAALVGADYDIKIANQKLADAIEAQAAAVEMATKQAADDAARLKAAKDREEAAAAAVARAEEELALAKELAGHDEKRWGAQAAAVQNRLDAARKALEDATTARIKAETAASVSASAAAQAEVEQTTAIRDAKLEVAVAEHAKAELEAAQAAAEAARIEKEHAEQKAALQKELQKEEQEFRDAQHELQEAIRARESAERAAAEAVAKYEENYGQNVLASAVFNHQSATGMQTNWGQFLTAIGSNVNKIATNKAVEQAINNGNIKTVAEMNKFAGDFSRDFAKANQKQAQRMAAEAQRYEELSKKSAKALSGADKAFMKQYEAIQEAALKQEREMMAARQAADKARIAEQEARDKAAQEAQDVRDIKQKLTQLGLK